MKKEYRAGSLAIGIGMMILLAGTMGCSMRESETDQKIEESSAGGFFSEPQISAEAFGKSSDESFLSSAEKNASVEEAENAADRRVHAFTPEKALQIACDAENLDREKVTSYETSIDSWQGRKACGLKIEYGDCYYEAWIDLENKDVLGSYHMDVVTGEHGNHPWEKKVQEMRCACGGTYEVRDVIYGEWQYQEEVRCQHRPFGTDLKKIREIEAQLQCISCGESVICQETGESCECHGFSS